jgi:cytochrome c
MTQAMPMRKAIALAIASGSLCLAAGAFADEDLFRKSNCMACHAIDQKRVGPSLKDVAARYGNDTAAAGMLARKIREGGVGAWGEMPMPPQPQVSEPDAKALADYILSIR